MMKIKFNEKQEYRILCLGAHSDDIEIGCGGTILKLLEDHKNIVVCWVVFSADKERAKEVTNSSQMFLKNTQDNKVIIKNFRESFFPYIGAEIKEYFEQLKEFNPDIIFTHCNNDLHQDHRLINQLTWNTFRNNLILEYEVPKYDGDLGIPNFFVPLKEPICHKKVEYILKSFKSQSKKHWFSKGTFLGIAKLRGVESNSEYAEAFYCKKFVYS